MNLRMRQICLVARELAPVVEVFHDVFGLDVCHRDPGVGKYGLENALFAIGNGFLEVVAPVRDGTTAGRYLVDTLMKSGAVKSVQLYRLTKPVHPGCESTADVLLLVDQKGRTFGFREGTLGD